MINSSSKSPLALVPCCLVILWLAVLGVPASLPAPAWGAPIADEGGDEEATDADAAAEGDAADSGKKSVETTENMLWWIIKTSGWIGAIILVLSIYFVATIIRLFMEMHLENAVPPELMANCNSLLEKRDYKGLYTAVKDDPSFFGTVVSAGMAELSIGLPEARDAMERVGEVRTVEMEKQISMLAVIGTLGPMIGLLGTLQGMILSFSVIARSDTQLKPGEVAGGISSALLLTFEGVALSVPAIYFFAVFRNRVSTISAAAMLTADEFIRRLANAARARPAGTAPPTPPPPPATGKAVATREGKP